MKKIEVEALYDRAEAEFGKIDVSIQNAGVITIARIEELSENDWDRVMAVNTKGVFLCCQAAALRMRPRRVGRIINTASGQARQGFIYTPHYAASKFGVIGITQSLAKELAPDNITVNAFCLGIIETDMWAYNDAAWGKLLGNYKPGELMQEWVNNIPMKRAGKAADDGRTGGLSGLGRRGVNHRADYQRRWRVDHVVNVASAYYKRLPRSDNTH